MEQGEGRGEMKQKKEKEPVVLQTLQTEQTFPLKKWHSKGPGIARDMGEVQSWGGEARAQAQKGLKGPKYTAIHTNF